MVVYHQNSLPVFPTASSMLSLYPDHDHHAHDHREYDDYHEYYYHDDNHPQIHHPKTTKSHHELPI
jgi:hypothetical protein